MTYILAISDGEKTNTPFDFIPPTTNLSTAPTTDELIKTFELDSWKAEKIPNHNEFSNQIHDSYHVRRDDNQTILCPYVKDRYQVYQYSDGVKWLDSFLQEGMLTIDSALMLNNGLQFSVLTSIGMEATITVKEDTVERYLLLALSHDGKRRGFYFTDIRPVCQNTLYMAMGQGLSKASKNFELGDTDPEKRIKQAKQLLDLANRKFYDDRVQYYKAYNELILEANQVDFIFRSVLNLPLGEESVKELTDIQKERYLTLKGAYNVSQGMEFLEKDTGWKVLNAITNFQQFGKTAQDKFFNSTFKGNSLRKNTEMLLRDLLPKTAIPVGG